jgi:hypothetical protein
MKEITISASLNKDRTLCRINDNEGNQIMLSKEALIQLVASLSQAINYMKDSGIVPKRLVDTTKVLGKLVGVQ